MVAEVWGGRLWRGDPREEVGVSGSLSMCSRAEERVRGGWKAGESMLETSWLMAFLFRRGGVRGVQSGRCGFKHFDL